MSLSGWFARQRAAFAKRDEEKAGFYLRSHAMREVERDKRHAADPLSQIQGVSRPMDPQPRADAVLTHTHNKTSKQ